VDFSGSNDDGHDDVSVRKGILICGAHLLLLARLHG
jgi:hypothetical protein